MTQAEAVAKVRAMLRGRPSIDEDGCTGNTDTCPVVECSLCALRDCPYEDLFHYHHDGCPSCAPHGDRRYWRGPR